MNKLADIDMFCCKRQCNRGCGYTEMFNATYKNHKNGWIVLNRGHIETIHYILGLKFIALWIFIIIISLI